MWFYIENISVNNNLSVQLKATCGRQQNRPKANFQIQFYVRYQLRMHLKMHQIGLNYYLEQVSKNFPINKLVIIQFQFENYFFSLSQLFEKSQIT